MRYSQRYFVLVLVMTAGFPQGSLVILHGGLVHRSSANTSDVPRHAYTFHSVEMGGDYTWDRDNWLQRDDFRCVYDKAA